MPFTTCMDDDRTPGYQRESLQIARMLVLSFSAGSPVKKRDLVRRINGENFSRAEVKEFFDEAGRFLWENSALKMIELPTVSLGTNGQSTQRGEIALVAAPATPHALLERSTTESQKLEKGVRNVILAQIVLSGNGVSLHEIADLLLGSRLLTDLGPENRHLRGMVLRLQKQRFLEAKQARTGEDPSTLYYIGAYTLETMSSSAMRNLVLALSFPDSNVHDESFLRQHDAVIKSIDSKIAAAGFR